VLNVAQLVAGQLEAGVSQQLLQGISDQLVGGVAPLVAGVDNLAAGTDQLAAGVAPLAFGTQQLADGLPAAVAGAGKIVTDAAQPLQQQGNQAAVNYGRQVALYTAMNNQDLVNASIPGGAATGDSVRTNGVYSFELAGTSSESTSTGVKYGLGLLALLAAAGVAAWLAVRQSRVG
jgi:X-X-X-Leu-X-X-Gly heptad repeat protein